MGWTFTRTTLTPKEFMDKEFENCSNEEFDVKILASGMGKGVYYAAVERIAKDGVIGKQKEVFCLVCPYKYKSSKNWLEGNEIGYKQMTEHCGPCYYDVPEKVWKVLEANIQYAPTDEYSQNWRNKVAENRRQGSGEKIEEGKYLCFEKPLEFMSGLKEHTFKVILAGRTKRYESVNLGFKCSIRRDTIRYGKYRIFNSLEDAIAYRSMITA